MGQPPYGGYGGPPPAGGGGGYGPPPGGGFGGPPPGGGFGGPPPGGGFGGPPSGGGYGPGPLQPYGGGGLSQVSDKEQATAFLLAMLAGTMGLDRFYLGQTGLGVAKLLTCGGLGVWQIIDTILLGMGKMTDAEGRPLKRPPMAGNPTRDGSTIFLASYFGGTFGLDRFLMGQVGLGVAKLLTCGGFGIWWLIDLFLIGTGSIRDAEGNSLKW